MKKPEAGAEHPVFVDRVEGETAVLLLGPEGKVTVNLPRALLPDGAGEGAHLLLTLRPDPEGKQRVADEVDRLMDDLLGGTEPEKPA